MDRDPLSESGAGRLIKPSLSTRFHIDLNWWRRNEREWRVYLLSHLCPEHRSALESVADGSRIDWVDPHTAEVRSIDGIQHALITHCSLQPEYISPKTTLVDAVFRVFLANGNTPLTVSEISEKIGRPANTILRTLSGARVYKGLRPADG
ncbi:MAG: hypothetical protein JW929_07485 [Anaerolineales bacterium]|nr:hypothetical protein [Anaerolineales bacterium]